MAYYVGDFRSLDQSVDPRGQLYRVLIFTGYNPNALNTQTIGGVNMINLGPYPYKSVVVGSLYNPSTGHYEMIRRNIPVKPSMLTMCDHPFSVKYVGEDAPYKNHRCSSATVTFLQENLNTDFISTLGTNCLVMLLKWRNSVHEVDGHYEDDITGAGLYKHTHTFNDGVLGPYTYWDDYYPWEWDSFCYDVEWIGFSTPNVLSCEYNHKVDRFSLECQDALSTLQYKKFQKDADESIVEDEMSAILRSLLILGVYKNVYVTTAIHFPFTYGNIEWQAVPYGTALRWTGCQSENFFNENGDAERWLDVLDSIMQYNSLTMVPWKDSLYIISDDAIAGGMTEYEHWTLSGGSQNRPWMLPAEPITYASVSRETVNIIDTVDINKDMVCGPNTRISSGNVYDEVKVVCDEMHPENLFPNMEDDDNFDTNVPAGQPIAEHVAQSGGYIYWECYGYGSAIDSIKCYHHGIDLYSGSYPSIWVYWRPDSEKTEVQTSQIYKNSGTYFFDNLTSGQWCFIMDDNECPKVASSSDTPHTTSYKRKFFFVNDFRSPLYPASGPSPEGIYRDAASITGTTTKWNYDSKDAHTYNTDEYDYRQTMLEVHSKKVLFNSHQYINLKGNWKFYRNQSQYRHFPCSGWGSYAGFLEWSADNAFIYAYVRFVPDDPNKPVLYLNCQNDVREYNWVSTKTMSKLPLDTSINPPTRTVGTSGGGTADIKDVMGMSVPFASPIQNIDGLYFNLAADNSAPLSEGHCEPGHIEILIDRQLGPTTNRPSFCTSTVYTLEDFELNVVSDTYVDTKGKKEPEKDNSEYRNILLENAANQMPQVDMVLSSTPNRGLSYAETCRMGISRRSGGRKLYKSDLTMINEVSGALGIPEQLKIDAAVRQFKEPLLSLQMPLFSKGLSPISRFMWARMGDKRFVVDSLDIDYEYEQCDVNIMQVRPTGGDTQTPVEATPATRNYRRTRDIIFQGRSANRVYRELIIPERVVGTTVEVTDSNVTIETDNVDEGASRIYTDFDRGQVMMAIPGSGMTVSNNNGQVTLITT